MASGAPNVRASGRLRRVAWPVWVASLTVIVLLVLYPPVRIVPRGGSAPAASGSPAAAVFEPRRFAETFWSEKLVPACARASVASDVLPRLRSDTTEVLRKHGHRVGLGRATYLFVRGRGRVTTVEKSRVLLDVEGTVIALRTGPVFGNAVRDGAGLITVNDVPGLTEFNALSAELNRLVEERVQPAIRAVETGAIVEFAGCAEVPESLPEEGPVLSFIPLQVRLGP